MNRKIFIFCLIFVPVFASLMLASCDILDSIFGDGGFTPTNEQMIAALKEALTMGTEDAGSTLSLEDAFYKNPLRYIPLPPEAKPILDHAANLDAFARIVFPSGLLQPLIDDIYLQVNRAAEYASNEVAPIFGNAIVEMTIMDAVGILKGSDTEATDYFRKTTTDPLKLLFGPELDKALNKAIVGNVSAQSTWDTLVSNYNNILKKRDEILAVPGAELAFTFANANGSQILNSIKDMKVVDADLNAFVLDKALTATFNEIAGMEKKIRADPIQFLSDIGTKVFNWAKETVGL